jgi:hypothetical protein
MRVISQNWDTDLDYESFVFTVRNTNFDDTSIIEEKGYKLDYVIAAVDSTNEYIMASYSTREKACDVLKSMSETYKRYMITTRDGNMQITDGLTYELDTPFEKFDIKELEASSFIFPKEEEVEV